MTPNDGAVPPASPKDARDRHAAMRVIDLVFCPLNVIELILLSENENHKRILQNPCDLFPNYLLRLIVDGSSIGLFASFSVLCVFART